MNISKYNILLFANICVYLFLSAFVFPKSMFDGAGHDGFYNQIFHVAEGEVSHASPLYPVHLLRYLVVSPFYYLHTNGYPQIIEAFLVLIFLLPVLTAKFGNKKVYGQVIFVYLPILFSYRSVLAMCSISYLFICLYGDRKNNFRLLLSLFLANLSSGVVLAWVLIVVANIKCLAQRYKYVRVAFLLAIVVLGFSITQKADFFYNEFSSGITLFERSTFYVSIINEQYLRFTVYSLLLVAWLIISLAKIEFRSFSWRLYSFYLPMFIAFFFEGIGLISFIIPLAWFFMGVRPPIKNTETTCHMHEYKYEVR